MLLKKFYINLIIRIVLILSNMIAISLIFPVLLRNQLMFTIIVLAVILILQIIFLINYLKKSNRLLAKFILAISNSDFTSKFGIDYTDTPYKDLNLAFNKIIDQYQFISKEKETQYSFTNHLIQTIPAGILVFNKDEKISFKNKLGESLLGLKEIYSLKQIERELPLFYLKLTKIEISGSFVYETFNSGDKKKLSVTVKSFKLFKRNQKLISIQDISKEIDAGEIDAIQRLMRILTHEIMNSLTPINSLTETITMLMNDEKGNPKSFEKLSTKNFYDIRESILAIKERGEGLDHFVNNFRILTKLPEMLETETVLVKEILSAVCKIMEVELKSIDVQIDIESDELDISVDNALVEQVLINLITNSLTAMSNTKNPILNLKSFQIEDQVIIQVLDNGDGIPEQKLTDIFMPFYSTKEKGSGIGLSFARQIMRLHNGSINVQSELGEQTIFSLKFQK